MKYFIATLLVGAPLLIICAGLYFVATTPEVITEYTEKVSSHDGYFMMILLGGLLSVITGMIAYTMVDD